MACCFGNFPFFPAIGNRYKSIRAMMVKKEGETVKYDAAT